MLKLNIGCGDIYFDGWINIDLDSAKADLKIDVRNRLPYDDNSVDFIYCEHFIEHLTVEEGITVLKDFHRVLKVGGILRIATPDLDYVLFRYFFMWKSQLWLKKYGYEWIKTKAEMINISFRDWGHKYLYNYEELKRRLIESEFKSQNIKKQKICKSRYADLTNRETRKDSKLILEALK